MTSESLLRVIALCVVLAGAETLHGIVRTVWVTPCLGKVRAIQLSALSGSLLAFGICWLLVPGIGLQSACAHFLLGLGLAGFMACFDIAVGMGLMHKPWAKVQPDFDPRTGNFLSFGLLALVFMPLLTWLARVS